MAAQIFFCFFLVFFSFSCTLVSSAPQTVRPRSSLRRSTHHARVVGRGLRVETYHPKTHYETFGVAGLAAPALPKGKTTGDPLKFRTTAFISDRLGVGKDDVNFKGGYTIGKTKYAYVRQSYNGIPFANAVSNIAFSDNKIVAFGSSFVEPGKLSKLMKGRPKLGKAKAKSGANSKPTIDTKISIPDAIERAEEALDGTYNDHPTSLEWLVKSDGQIALTHVVQIQNMDDDRFEWYEAFVDANDGTILSVTDFVKDATYTVLPISKTNLTEGQETVKNPEDLVASPWGWHNDGETNSTDTTGNNVLAFKRISETNDTIFTNASSILPLKSAASPSNSSNSSQLVFDFPYNPEIPADTPSNLDSARTNVFYLMNMVHDIAYRYGFTESAFNFQVNNMGKGGQEGDPVLVSVQDDSGVNNANFGTPPDGQPGVCRMYIWNISNPDGITQDGSLENDVPVHEMMHGITNRMTGGGTGRCLDTVEAGGLGEGWSDAMAGWVKATKEMKDVVIGAFVSGKPGGLRAYPYSRDEKVNPLKYGDLQTMEDESHVIGEIWANMLHNMLGNLIDVYGFSTTAFTNPDGKEGNVVFLHLLMDALALQPCNPTFLDARNAWIQADVNRYNGTNVCLIWKTFASRGLGVDAKDHTDGFEVPPECGGSDTGDFPPVSTPSRSATPSSEETATSISRTSQLPSVPTLTGSLPPTNSQLPPNTALPPPSSTSGVVPANSMTSTGV